MALEANEIYVAGTGLICSAPEDTAMPATPPDGLVSPVTPWIDHGYATEDGVEFTFGKSTDELKGWQSFDTLRLLTTEAPKSVKFTLMQANADNLLLALGGGETDVDTGLYTPPDPSVLDIRALYIYAIDGGETWEFWCPRALLSDNVVIPWKKSGEAQLPLTFSVQAANPTPFNFRFPIVDDGAVATGADEGAPGSFTPAGSSAPLALSGMSGITANPATAWATGSHVVLGDASDAYWDGTDWVTGTAP